QRPLAGRPGGVPADAPDGGTLRRASHCRRYAVRHRAIARPCGRAGRGWGLMDPVQPFLLLRARPEPEDAEEFRAWLHRVHLPDARKIPGFSTIEAGQTPAGTFLVFYSFESTD